VSERGALVVSRRIIHTLLSRIEAGRIDLVETYPGGESRNFGSLAHVGRPLRPRLEIHDPAVYARLVRSRSIGLGTTYAEGLWDCDERLYMAISEAGFSVARIRDVQILFAKPEHEPSLAPAGRLREAAGLA
jgi:hypothetical protein